MSERIDITGNIFNDIYVLEFEKKQNTHARYKCLCMLCNEITYATYTNLTYGNTTKCRSCGRKSTNYKDECEIMEKLAKNESPTTIAQGMTISRSTVSRFKKEMIALGLLEKETKL